MAEGPRRPRVLLADDDAHMRAAIVRLLSLSCDVVGWVADTVTLFDAVVRLQPDVVLLDLSLAGKLNAIEACRLITSRTPAARVVIFTADDDADLREVASHAGASAYVWKLQASDELARTIHAVVADTGGSVAANAS